MDGCNLNPGPPYSPCCTELIEGCRSFCPYPNITSIVSLQCFRSQDKTLDSVSQIGLLVLPYWNGGWKGSVTCHKFYLWAPELDDTCIILTLIKAMLDIGCFCL